MKPSLNKKFAVFVLFILTAVLSSIVFAVPGYVVGGYYEFTTINATTNETLEGYVHSDPINITFNYTDWLGEIYDENNLDVYLWNESQQKWTAQGASLDTGTNVLLLTGVTHFSYYAVGEKTNLSIWDDTDAEGGSWTKYPGDVIGFYANYTNSTGDPITDGNCTIKFNFTSSWFGFDNMTYNSGSGLYEYDKTFSTDGFYKYFVNCTSNVENITAQDDFWITATVSAVPEFSTITLILALIVTTSGFFIIRKRKSYWIGIFLYILIGIKN